MSTKSHIGKAPVGMVLCFGVRCNIRSKCLRYNLEPSHNQDFLNQVISLHITHENDCGHFKEIKGGTHDRKGSSSN